MLYKTEKQTSMYLFSLLGYAILAPESQPIAWQSAGTLQIGPIYNHFPLGSSRSKPKPGAIPVPLPVPPNKLKPALRSLSAQPRSVRKALAIVIAPHQNGCRAVGAAEAAGGGAAGQAEPAPLREERGGVGPQAPGAPLLPFRSAPYRYWQRIHHPCNSSSFFNLLSF